VIVFDAYVGFDFFQGVRYGVIRAVNELIVNDDWRVCGLSLHPAMFCNVAIRRQSGSSPWDKNLKIGTVQK
jgi:hypothetical protein